MKTLALVLLFATPVEFDPTKHGCVRTSTEPEMYTCAEGPIAKLGCSGLRHYDALGGLAAPAAAMECYYEFGKSPWVEGVRPIYPGLSGQPPSGTNCLLLYDGNTFELLTTQKDLLRRIAPVDAPEEALALALLLSGDPRVDDVEIAGERWKGRRPKTHVTRTNDGYVVHNLFSSGYGCIVDLRVYDLTVSRDGEVKAFGAARQVPTAR